MKDLELATGPGPALIRHGRRYLEGCLNEEARDAWMIAIAQALGRNHGALDAAIRDICETYVQSLSEWGREDTNPFYAGNPADPWCNRCQAHHKQPCTSSIVGRADSDGAA